MTRYISYAQNGEDVILTRIFGSQKYGFYVDIGASHPKSLSVTKNFYDSGWRGVNVEPLKHNYELFIQERPRDTNLNLLISAEERDYIFFEVRSYPELSTLDEEHAKVLQAAGHDVVSYTVPAITSSQLFERYISEDVDFLKIDVEGGEYEVVSSLDLNKYRPKILIIEATKPNSAFPGWENLKSVYNHQQWEKLVLDSNYLFAHFDGLNRFYVRGENPELLDYFTVGLCSHDAFIRADDAQHILELEKHAADRLEQVEVLTKLLSQVEEDRAARGTQIETLTEMVRASEADRAARGEQITTLTEMVRASEADRTARGEQIAKLSAILQKKL